MLSAPATMPPSHITEKSGSEPTRLVKAVRAAFEQALRDEGKLNPAVLAMHGMSGRRYRHFINALIAALDDARYLEIGCWAGSTMCSAIYGNRLRAFGIDNWSEFGGPSQEFLQRVAECMSWGVDFNMLTQDFRKVDYRSIGRFNVCLFDGPHTEADQYDGVWMPLPALDDEYVLIVDDWNWESVRAGTVKAIRDHKLQVVHAIEVRTTLDNSHPLLAREQSDWHNGYCISVLRKPGFQVIR